MKRIWEYLASLDEESTEMHLMNQGIGTLLASLTFGLIYILTWAVGIDLFISGIVGCAAVLFTVAYIATSVEYVQMENREKALEEARHYGPENVFGDAQFAGDEGLAEKHFLKEPKQV